MKEVEAEGGRKLLVLHNAEGFHVYDAICPHQEVPLCEGLYDGSVLTCHEHLWQWNVNTGEAIGLAECPLQPFPTSVDGDEIHVELGGQGAAAGTGN